MRGCAGDGAETIAAGAVGAGAAVAVGASTGTDVAAPDAPGLTGLIGRGGEAAAPTEAAVAFEGDDEAAAAGGEETA
jgi:hypothetical protein